MDAAPARSILKTAPMTVVTIDGHGPVRSANATAGSVFGGRLNGAPSHSVGRLIAAQAPRGVRRTGALRIHVEAVRTLTAAAGPGPAERHVIAQRSLNVRAAVGAQNV